VGRSGSRWVSIWTVLTAVSIRPAPAAGQQSDTTRSITLPPLSVSAARSEDSTGAPRALAVVTRADLGAAQRTWGIDEVLSGIPGVYASNRYNFSLDERLSIRGFGFRSSFGVRGVKILLDGIPQTLPDGQGQLTNLDLWSVDRVEVVRGSSSALFGNASGGVISLWSDPPRPSGLVAEEVRVLGGRSTQRPDRSWTKWQSTTDARVGSATLQLLASRFVYDGERDHSAADLRNFGAHLYAGLGGRWTLTALADAGDQPRADNPGALTLPEFRANPDSVAPINVSTHAGKAVTQVQGGVTLGRRSDNGGQLAITVFGLTRSLQNPTTFAYIDLDRLAGGARVTVAQPFAVAGRSQVLTTGFDLQRQRDDRRNFGNNGGTPDTVRSLDQLEHVTEFGPFVQSAVTLSPGVIATGGLRYDWVDFQVTDRLVTPTNPDDSGDRLMHALSGSLGVSVTPRAPLTLFANVASSFETPTTTELTNRPDTAGGFNPDLQPQQAWNYEIGGRGSLGGWGRWSLAVFQADVKDELIPFAVPASPQRVFYRNAGAARHRGVEVGGAVTVARGVTLSASYTYSDFRYTSFSIQPDTSPRTIVLDGRPLPGIPRDWGHVALRAAPRVAHGGWVEIETTHSSGFYVDDTLNTWNAPWWATDVRAGWTGAVGHVVLSPFLGVANAFDAAYVGSVVINAARGRYYEPAPGRAVYLGVTTGVGGGER